MITYRKLHNIKLEQQYVKPIVEKEKTFEIRYNDRDYKVGDIIRFKPTTDNYYGDLIKNQFYVITYMFNDFGLDENYAVFSFKELTDEKLISTLYTLNDYFKYTKIIPIPDRVVAVTFLDNTSEYAYKVKDYLKKNDEELWDIVKELNKE